MFSQELLLRLADVPLSLDEARAALKAALTAKGYADASVSVEVKTDGAVVWVYANHDLKPFPGHDKPSGSYIAQDPSALVALVRAWGAVEAMPYRRAIEEPRAVETATARPAVECAA